MIYLFLKQNRSWILFFIALQISIEYHVLY